MRVVRYRLNIAYDGTDFCGWQKQEPLAPADEAAAAAWAPDAHGISSEYTDGPGAERGGPDYRGVPRIESERAGRIALRTVQGVVERAVREVVRERVEVLGASRTDAGVHARGQVAAFTCSGERIGQGPHVHAAAPEEAGNGSSGAPADAEGEPAPGVAGGRSERAERDPAAKNDGGWPESRGVERLVRAINGRLPDDVIVTGASVAAPGFDPVFGAERKAYSYTLHVGRERPLWDRRFVHHVWTPLELERMREAASVLVGEHDFRGFAAAGHGRQTTVRTVFRCQVTEMPVGEAAGGWATFGGAPGSPGDGRRVRIEVEGSGFLWNMVRIIAGTLVEVGRGRLGMEDVRAALREGDRRRAGPTLAPGGLCLEWIRYADGGSDGPGRTGNTGPGGRAETHHEEPA